MFFTGSVRVKVQLLLGADHDRTRFRRVTLAEIWVDHRTAADDPSPGGSLGHRVPISRVANAEPPRVDALLLLSIELARGQGDDRGNGFGQWRNGGVGRGNQRGYQGATLVFAGREKLGKRSHPRNGQRMVASSRRARR